MGRRRGRGRDGSNLGTSLLLPGFDVSQGREHGLCGGEGPGMRPETVEFVPRGLSGPRHGPGSMRARFFGARTVVLALGALFVPGVLDVWRTSTCGGLVRLATAAPCNSSEVVEMIVSPSNAADLVGDFGEFNCEGGEFEVEWSGYVAVNGTIVIGEGTRVAIFGDYDNGLLAANGSDSSTSTSTSTGTRTSNTYGSEGSGGGGSELVASSAFGPIFSVTYGELYLERMAVRDGTAQNTTSPGIISGGGVHAFGSSLEFAECEFTGMFAELWGGAIFANFSDVQAHDTVFRDCRAGETVFAGDEDADGAGGGIAVENSSVLVERCMFEENYASMKGGGIHQGVGNVTILDSIFRSNTAGSIYADGEEAMTGEGADVSLTECLSDYTSLGDVCLIQDSVFLSSRVGSKGAVLQVGSGDGPSNVEINRCYVFNATCGAEVEDDPQGEGGAFSMGRGTILTVRDTVVNKTWVGKKGAAITLSSADDEGTAGGIAILVNSTFTGCRAELESGGVVYLNKYAMLNVTGHDNRFLDNSCGGDGGVVAATTGAMIYFEGGIFSGNTASDSGGVLWTKEGDFRIYGGEFYGNKADQGGVWFVSGDANVTIEGGTFWDNSGGYGGVGTATGSSSGHSKVLINGGNFTGNKGANGGVFAMLEYVDFQIAGGNFTDNEGDYGGVLFKESEGLTNCTGTSLAKNKGLDGGAIYAMEEATLDWQCDLIENEAVSGPAIYARGDASITLRGITLSDNTISRGSVVFLVGSVFQTFQVVFNDSSKSSDLSAVQVDDGSTFIAEETSFVGFQGEAVVFSQNVLVLDDCDFRYSSAEVLVDASEDGTTIIRNAILGDMNYEAAITKAAQSNELPNVDEMSTVNFDCLDDNGDSICNGGNFSCGTNSSVCIVGDLGVYCQSYVREASRQEICISSELDSLELSSSPERSSQSTYYPDYITEDFVLSFGTGSNSSTTSSSLWDSDEGVALARDGVVWNASAYPSSDTGVVWIVFPSTGLLLPGDSITLRAVGDPSKYFDGTQTVTVTVDVMGAGTYNDQEGSLRRLEDSVEVTYYHCEESSYWDLETEKCRICADYVNEPDGVDCSSPGQTTLTLTVMEGYWRASNESLTIRQCLNEDACKGGLTISSSDDYCNVGYEGPYCAVCAEGYGPGVANECHKCTEDVKAWMYSLLVMAALFTIVFGILIAIYLVGGGDAVTSTLDTTRDSIQKLKRRSSSLLLSTSVAFSVRTAEPGPEERATDHKDEANVEKPRSGWWSSGRVLTRLNVPVRKGQSAYKGSAGSGVLDFNSIRSRGGQRQQVDSENESGVSQVNLVRQDQFKSNASWEIYAPPPRPAEASKSSKASEPLGTGEEVATGGSGEGAGGEHEAQSLESGQSADARVEQSLTEDEGKRDFVAAQDMRTPVVFPAASNWDANDPLTMTRAAKDVDHDIPARAARAYTGTELGGRAAKVAARPTGRDKDSRDRRQDRERAAAEPKKSKAARIAQALGKIPLAKLKIVIVVWQITSAFTEITQVSYPRAYEHFLEVIGIFTFDLGWIFSAACLTTELDFYDKLLIVTIGPMVLFLILGVTFTIGTWKAVRDRPDQPFSVTDTSLSSRMDPSLRRTQGGDWNDPSAAIHDRPEAGDEGPATPPHVPGFPALRQRSLRDMFRAGPGEVTDPLQNRLWWLFSRHTTMFLIILYLVYSQVSTVVFQTFACEDMSELGKRFLLADFTVECDTPRHKAYEVYAWIMIVVYPVGIPAAFWYFLKRQSTRINPKVQDEEPRDLSRAPNILTKKMEVRGEDETVAPTSFLWAAYWPHRYYFEVFECLRRLLLTGLLVFVQQERALQVAMSCIFAFVSLLVFEIYRPHNDDLDMQLYRTGCLVIFFSNFLALMLEAEVADAEDDGAELFAVALVILNVLLFMSIWCNTYASIKAIFSRERMQDTFFGVSVVDEKELDKFLQQGKAQRPGEAKTGEEYDEEIPAWDEHPSNQPASLVSAFGGSGPVSGTSMIALPPSSAGMRPPEPQLSAPELPRHKDGAKETHTRYRPDLI